MDIKDLQPGDSIVVTLQCGFCKASVTHNATELYREHKFPFYPGEVASDVMHLVMQEQGWDLVLGYNEATIRCARCKELKVSSKDELVAIPKKEHERLLEIERKYEEGDESKDDDQDNPEGGW